MPFFKDDLLNVKYWYATSRVLYDDEEVQDDRSQGSDKDGGYKAWDKNIANSSDTGSTSVSGGSSSDDSKSGYCGVYEDNDPTSWDMEMASNSDTGSGSSTSGSKSGDRGVYQDDGPTAWDMEMAGNSDTGSGGSTSGSKSVDSTGKGKGKSKERGAGRGKWFKKIRMMFDRLQVDEKKEKPRKKVKSILRPPVRFTYVTGMSGITSRVPVFEM